MATQESEKVMSYPISPFSPDIHEPKGPAIGGHIYLVDRQTRQLPVLQTRDVVDNAALEARTKRDEIKAAVAELAAMKERHKSEQKRQEARILSLQEEAERKDVVATSYYAPDSVTVELRANSATQTMHHVRTDTGQELMEWRRTLYADEVQSMLPDLDDPNQMDKLRRLIVHLPATSAELAMREDLAVSADEADSLMRGALARSLVSGGKNQTWTLTDDGRLELRDDASSSQEAVASRQEWSALELSSDALTVLRTLASMDGGQCTARGMAHALGDAWRQDRAHTALNDLLDAKLVSGKGGPRSKRTLTDAGARYVAAHQESLP